MRAKKSLGQNFLRDERVSQQIVAALDLGTDDTVIEIGPGQGALTEIVLGRVQRLVAVEFDRDLVGFLTNKFLGRDDLTIIGADALDFDFSTVVQTQGGAKLVANLPYNISTPILQRLIDQRHLFDRLVLMFQREVVERITARPGTSERGFLSVLVEAAFVTERLFDVPPTAFSPVPKVWSSVVSLTPKPGDDSDRSKFRHLVSASFMQKRKTLLNNLKQTYQDAERRLSETGIDGGRRAETLTLDEWKKLARRFAENDK